MFTRLINFLSLIYGFVVNSADPTLSSEETKQQRLKICSTCPLKTTIVGSDQCSACGCIIESKVIWEKENCPKRRW